MEHVESTLVSIAFFAAITIIITNLFNFILKKRIIDSVPLDEPILKFLTSLSGARAGVLKWGFLFFFGGIGLVVIEFLPYKADQSTLPYGIEAIFLAVGFFVYYFTTRHQKY